MFNQTSSGPGFSSLIGKTSGPPVFSIVTTLVIFEQNFQNLQLL